MSTLSNTSILSPEELHAISPEAFMRKAEKVNNLLYRLASFCVLFGALTLLFVCPSAMAQAEDAGDKVSGFLKTVKKALGPISILVVTIAFIFAGYQIAFNHKRISDVAPVLIGAIIIGAATQLASWFIKIEDFE